MAEIFQKNAELDAYLEGSLFKDFPLIPEQALVEKYGDYVFTDCKDGGTGQTLSYFFAKNKTDDEKNTPFESRWIKFGNHRHPPILKGLAFIEDYSFPNATNIIQDEESGIAVSPRNYLREAYIAEVNEGSRFLLDEFVSPTPFLIGQYPVPQPGRVSYQLNGLHGSFEECLHDDLEIPASNGATTTLVDGSETSVESRIAGQFFPRTNFKRRRPYIFAADQEKRNGVHYMQRLRVFPPRTPKVTIAA